MPGPIESTSTLYSRGSSSSEKVQVQCESCLLRYYNVRFTTVCCGKDVCLHCLKRRVAVSGVHVQASRSRLHPRFTDQDLNEDEEIPVSCIFTNPTYRAIPCPVCPNTDLFVRPVPLTFSVGTPRDGSLSFPSLSLSKRSLISPEGSSQGSVGSGGEGKEGSGGGKKVAPSGQLAFATPPRKRRKRGPSFKGDGCVVM